jgi:hypothetical protein
VHKSRAGGVCRTASRVAEAECVSTSASPSDGRRRRFSGYFEEGLDRPPRHPAASVNAVGAEFLERLRERRHAAILNRCIKSLKLEFAGKFCDLTARGECAADQMRRCEQHRDRDEKTGVGRHARRRASLRQGYLRWAP